MRAALNSREVDSDREQIERADPDTGVVMRGILYMNSNIWLYIMIYELGKHPSRLRY